MSETMFASLLAADIKNEKWFVDVGTKEACEDARGKTGQTSDGGDWFKWNSSEEEC